MRHSIQLNHFTSLAMALPPLRAALCARTRAAHSSLATLPYHASILSSCMSFARHFARLSAAHADKLTAWQTYGQAHHRSNGKFVSPWPSVPRKRKGFTDWLKLCVSYIPSSLRKSCRSLAFKFSILTNEFSLSFDTHLSTNTPMAGGLAANGKMSTILCCLS